MLIHLSLDFINTFIIFYTFMNERVDKNSIYMAHVSMKSIMISQNKDTFIQFYVISNNFDTFFKEIINEITKKHSNCKIQYFEIGNQFKNLTIPNSMWSTAIFYRIILQDLLPNLDKILYLDTDTLIFKDLTEIFNYNIYFPKRKLKKSFERIK